MTLSFTNQTGMGTIVPVDLQWRSRSNSERVIQYLSNTTWATSVKIHRDGHGLRHDDHETPLRDQVPLEACHVPFSSHPEPHGSYCTSQRMTYRQEMVCNILRVTTFEPSLFAQVVFQSSLLAPKTSDLTNVLSERSPCRVGSLVAVDPAFATPLALHLAG